MKKYIAIVSVFLFAPTVYAGTTEPINLSTTTVVNKGTALQNPVASSVQVITREDIEKSAASNLVDILQGKAGIQIKDSIGDRRHVSFSLRGFGENSVNNTLLLVDGRPLNEPTMKAPNFNAIPLFNIERVEIIRGSGAVLYGDQAVGGVINIITRQPQGTGGYIEATRGSQDMEVYRGNTYLSLDNGLSVYLSGVSGSGDNYRKNNQTNYDDFFARLRYDHDLGWLLYEHQTSHDNLHLPGSLTYKQKKDNRRQSSALDWQSDRTKTDRFALQQRLTDELTAYLDYANSKRNGEVFTWGTDKKNSTDIESFSPRITLRLATGTELLAGYDYIKSEAKGFNNSTQRKEDWYINLNQPLNERLFLTLGYRTSKVDDSFTANNKHHGRENSTSLGLVWQATDNLQFFLKREDVLRWANVDDNGLVLPQVVYLKPQTGTSWESGLEWVGNKQRHSLSLYRLNLNNEIFYDAVIANPDSFYGYGANINLDGTRRQGLMYEGSYDVTQRLTLLGQYSLTDARYRKGSYKGNAVGGVARHAASLMLDYALLDGFNLQLEAAYTGASYLSSDDGHTQGKEGGYTLYNLAAVYHYKNFSTKLRVNNIFNKNYNSYASVYGYYPAPKQVAELSVGYRF
ncbi:TonB-dependent receptor [Pseudomonas sp. F1_0610]|uniref:TonB-dependent receptor domain-containing protein n=1 Tax=Pseudomonas sp. F1_0610 TaxID=3114284 RepID=UPI0039C0427D